MRSWPACGRSYRLVAVESSVTSAPQELVIHPRVAQQGFADEDLHRLLGQVLPRVAPFRGRGVHSLVATLDWDHRLPSKALTLRLHLCYDEAGRARHEQALARRRAEIADRDRFPE